MKTLVTVCALAYVSTIALAQTAATAPSPADAPAQPGANPARPGSSVGDPQANIADLQKKLLDWPQLNRYHERNAQLAPPAAGEQRVIFFGDSITEGWGRHWDQFFAGKPYIDRGIGGQSSQQMVLRFHQDVIDLKPAVVILLAGTNDVAEKTGPMTPEMTLDDFRAMLEMARANNIKMVVCSILPAADFPWNRGLEPAPKIRALNQHLKAWADSEHLVWVDYYTSLADGTGGMKAGLSLDGVHPTPAGYAIMAPLAEAGIAKALGNSKTQR
jgi:lysophospholipase L1-like esterase